MVLLPKIKVPKEVKDFRLITLVHSFAKIISKLLANRLSAFLLQLVCENQSTFIKGRFILDNYKQWRMYTPGHPCHGPGFGSKNC